MARFSDRMVPEVVQVFWAAMARGEFVTAAAAEAGTYREKGTRWLAAEGGIRPRRGRDLKGRCLTFAEREEIALGRAAGESMRAIARRLGRTPSTVSRELARNTGRGAGYRATRAHALAYERASRPKPAKLHTNLKLRRQVEEDLTRRYSPEQIVGRLRRQFPDDPEMRVSAETIYQSLYVQSRGALRRDLTRCLRTGRALRRPGRQANKRRNQIPDMINITERPAQADDRAVPGHWEGDLILGKNNLSAIGTLVERTTGYTMLVHLPNGYKTEQVRDALTQKIKTIPDILRASLTWDQGAEMGAWKEVSVAADIDIYFCDPHSPWQRGTSENTNGLLRQYFPKGTDLSVHSAVDLEWVATELNDRPRKRLGGWCFSGGASDSQVMLEGMSLGLTPTQANVFTTTSFCDGRVAADSIYGLLHRECFQLFPDELFADLFGEVGRRSVPPMIVAVVMVLQRIEGCSDREAVDRFTYDARWKYAAGGLGFDYPGFAHTVLVDMRARLAGSERPDRIFEVVLEMGKRAGLVGRRRVLDSTALYDAVATMDTVTLIRSAIRGVLAACDRELEVQLRDVLARDDDYASAGKPVCDYEDLKAREGLIDALANDAHAILGVLDGRELPAVVAQAGAVLAVVVGQDLDTGADGVFRIARKVAKDRMISTVDPDTRHGRKTRANGFDGYKGHVAVDPDSELITATTVTAGNAGDAQAVELLLAEDLPDRDDPGGKNDPAAASVLSDPLSVYGDTAYGSGPVLHTLEQANTTILCKVKAPVGRARRFTKTDFQIDIDLGQVVCPAGRTASLREVKDGQAARFGSACQACPLFARCTTDSDGRTIHLGPFERQLARGRERQTDPAWQADYKATRPKIERKIGHLMRRRHGGRRARVRGCVKVNADFSLLAAAVNLARLATLGVTTNASIATTA